MTTKKLTIIKGRDTKEETRIETNITLYWCERLGRWVTIPQDGANKMFISLKGAN